MNNIMLISKEEIRMELLIGALFLAIWQSILFKNQNVGLSAILFVLPVLYITFRLLKGKIENKKALLISIPIILLSITYFKRFENVYIFSA